MFRPAALSTKRAAMLWPQPEQAVWPEVNRWPISPSQGILGYPFQLQVRPQVQEAGVLGLLLGQGRLDGLPAPIPAPQSADKAADAGGEAPVMEGVADFHEQGP